MQGVGSETQTGSMRAFITNGGPHSPETLAEMTYCQLFAPGGDTEAMTRIRQALTHMHKDVQILVRLLFCLTTNDEGNYEQVFRVILRDLATSMETERSYHKE